MISRKHFKALAESLKQVKPERDKRDGDPRQWEDDCRAVASVLATLNPRFDLARFLQACGFDSQEEQKAA